MLDSESDSDSQSAGIEDMDRDRDRKLNFLIFIVTQYLLYYFCGIKFNGF